MGYRNGHGKPRKLSTPAGTITVRRPRVRDLPERFKSRVLPLFKRHTKQVGALLPELYLHCLALGDFDLALRGLLGDAAPLSASSLTRLKAQWQRPGSVALLRRLLDHGQRRNEGWFGPIGLDRQEERAACQLVPGRHDTRRAPRVAIWDAHVNVT